MKIDQADIAQFLDLLAEAPRRIESATRELPETRLMVRTPEEPWSVSDILAHLRASADVRGKYINAMLAQEQPVMRYISPRTYIKKTNYLDLPFAESFQAYRKQRTELLKTLKGLSLKEWSRAATIKERPETVFSYTLYLTGHESAHCAQIEGLLKWPG
jgi:hypothetical protein